MAKKKFLKENEEQIWPITRADCVYVTNGTLLNEVLNKKSDEGHNHNNIYYTKNEISAFLKDKADETHIHDQYLPYYGGVVTGNIIMDDSYIGGRTDINLVDIDGNTVPAETNINILDFNNSHNLHIGAGLFEKKIKDSTTYVSGSTNTYIRTANPSGGVSFQVGDKSIVRVVDHGLINTEGYYGNNSKPIYFKTTVDLPKADGGVLPAQSNLNVLNLTANNNIRIGHGFYDNQIIGVGDIFINSAQHIYLESNNASGKIFTNMNFVPETNGEGSIGTETQKWGTIAASSFVGGKIALGHSSNGKLTFTKSDNTVVDGMYMTIGDNLRVGNIDTQLHMYSYGTPKVYLPASDGSSAVGYNIYHAGNKPTAADIGAATKDYVDTSDRQLASAINSCLPLAGGTMTGAITMANNKYISTTYTNGNSYYTFGLSGTNNLHIGSGAYEAGISTGITYVSGGEKIVLRANDGVGGIVFMGDGEVMGTVTSNGGASFKNGLTITGDTIMGSLTGGSAALHNINLTTTNASIEYGYGQGVVRVAEAKPLYLQTNAASSGDTSTEIKCTMYKNANNFIPLRAYNLNAVNGVYANGTNLASDRNLKENIEYLQMNNDIMTLSLGDENTTNDEQITLQDMYDFIKDELYLASYNYIDDEYNKTKINFIAQDLFYNNDNEDSKIGQIIVNVEESVEKQESLNYDLGNYTSILAGALKCAINEIEELKNINILLMDEISSLSNRLSIIENM